LKMDSQFAHRPQLKAIIRPLLLHEKSIFHKSTHALCEIFE